MRAERFAVAPIFIAERRQHALRVIDIRDAFAHAGVIEERSHIPGALQIAARSLRDVVAPWPRMHARALVDDDGTAARSAARQLRAMEFGDRG